MLTLFAKFVTVLCINLCDIISNTWKEVVERIDFVFVLAYFSPSDGSRKIRFLKL